jgi:hypothetical protein
MPVVRYFVVVGNVLLVLLFGLDWCLPKSASEPVQTDSDRLAIRIHSISKLPEPVVIDTSLPTITPAAPVAMIAGLSPRIAANDQEHNEAPTVDFHNPKSKPAAKKLPVKKVVVAQSRHTFRADRLSIRASGTMPTPSTKMSLLDAIKERFGRGFMRLN